MSDSFASKNELDSLMNLLQERHSNSSIDSIEIYFSICDVAPPTGYTSINIFKSFEVIDGGYFVKYDHWLYQDDDDIDMDTWDTDVLVPLDKVTSIKFVVRK